MAYSDISLEDLESKFGIKNQTATLFNEILRINPSESLQNSLSLAKELPVRSEKAKSELLVLPILLELRNINAKYFTIYSGENLNVEDPLQGECDFILAKDVGSFTINYPIIQVVEAKKMTLKKELNNVRLNFWGREFLMSEKA